MIRGETSQKIWTFKRIFAIFLIIVVVGCILWFFVLPILLAYESLGLRSYYFAVNNHGKIAQIVANLINNGTKDATIEEIWVNGVCIEHDLWGGVSGTTVQQYGERIFVAPKSVGFEFGQTIILQFAQ